MQEPVPTAKTPFGWRRARLVAGTLALSRAAFGPLAAVTATGASASFPPVTTQAYTIGTPASQVTNLSASVNPATGGSTGNYSVKFTTPAGLASGNVITVTISGATAFSSGTVSNPGLVDLTSGSVIGQTTTGSLSSGNLVVTTTLSAGVSTGDTLLLTFQATNPNVSSTGSSVAYTVSVTTTASATAASTSISYTPAAPGIGLSVSTNYLGVEANQASALTGTIGTVNWSSASFTVKDTTTSSVTVTTQAPTQVAAEDEVVVPFTVSAPTGSSDVLQVVISGVKNPTAPGETDYFGVAQGNSNPPTITAPGAVASPSVTYGSFVSGVSVTPSNTAASASGVAYTVSFISTDGVPAGDWIQFVGPDGTSFGSVTGAVVTDAKSGATTVLTGSAVSASTTTNTNDTLKLTLPANFSVSSGDPVTVTVFGVTNPASGSYSGSNGLQVTTQVDSIAANNATAYVIGAATVSSLAPKVTVTPPTAGALATYTIASFKAVSQLVAGTDTIEVNASDAGTTFPATGYTLMDVTANKSQNLTVNTGAYSHDVTLGLSSTVPAGDTLSLTISSVVNPITASSSDTITMGADNNSTNATAAGTQGLGTLALTFPGAATTFPNGAIVFFGGTGYVFAGGHPFGAPSQPALTAVQAVDPATVQTAASGATVPTTAARNGTLVTVPGKPAIYVVYNGQLYPFAAPDQIFSSGFDAALVITVPSLGGMTVSSTDVAKAGLTGFSTSSDGAIVNSSGTFFVFAGGKAFGIPGPAKLTAELASEPAGTTPSSGTVTSAMQSAAIADGVVVTNNGAVYVTSGGNLFPFKGSKQIANDGYGGTPSILIPNLGGLAVASYTGS